MNGIIRVGQYVGPVEQLDYLGRANLRRVKSVDNHSALATQKTIMGAAKEAGLVVESVFDAAHALSLPRLRVRQRSGAGGVLGLPDRVQTTPQPDRRSDHAQADNL